MNQDLVDYIRDQLKAGITDPEIRKILTESGWADEDIEKAFQALKTPGLESDGSVAVTTGDASGTSKFDLGINDNAGVTETKPDFDKEAYDMKTDKSEIKEKSAMIIWIILGVVGLTGVIAGIWMISKLIAGNIKKPKVEATPPSNENQLLSPVSEATDSGLPISVNTELKQFTSSKGGFKISHPKDWRVDESGSFGTLVSVANTVSDDDSGNKFSVNINVVSEAAVDVTLDDYLAASKEVLTKSFSNYQLIKEQRKTIGGKDGVILEARYDMGVYPLHNLQLLVIDKGKAYVITATALNSTWEKYQKQLDASLMSFILL